MLALRVLCACFVYRLAYIVLRRTTLVEIDIFIVVTLRKISGIKTQRLQKFFVMRSSGNVLIQ